ncbi:hypothetical protein HCY52_14975 [Acinetobacter radioresistens]|uniref:hypothetical protein n=1 Tax=Acinetobacter radioresistens TaxID=40216 RepID=UPI0020047DD3|nr:hypothetical protein [Acinetobacter radioresistens]MCK4085115.1 hypothetical protein [Acinetobacter radioresistens]
MLSKTATIRNKQASICFDFDQNQNFYHSNLEGVFDENHLLLGAMMDGETVYKDVGRIMFPMDFIIRECEFSPMKDEILALLDKIKKHEGVIELYKELDQEGFFYKQ